MFVIGRLIELGVSETTDYEGLTRPRCLCLACITLTIDFVRLDLIVNQDQRRIL